MQQVEVGLSDDEAVLALVDAIRRAEGLEAGHVQEIGLDRFDPARHFRVLAGMEG